MAHPVGIDAGPHRQLERGAALPIKRIHRGAAPEQRGHDLVPAAPRRDVQRGAARGVVPEAIAGMGHIHRHAEIEEPLHAIAVAVGGEIGEQGRSQRAELVHQPG